jgi:hypothetical protein
LIAHRWRSPLWRVTRGPRMKSPHANGMTRGVGRLTAGFEYVGPVRKEDAVFFSLSPGTPGDEG